MEGKFMLHYAPRYNLNESIDESSSQGDSKVKIESAQYIADMILELRNLAKAAEFNTLQGLLEISYYEAFSAANQIRIPRHEDAFLHELGSDARKAAAA
jgi:hypothetical protein